MSKTGFVYHPDYLRHDSGYGHPESPARLRGILEHLEKSGLLSRTIPIDPAPADIDDIILVHDRNYVDRVRESCERGDRYLDSFDTGICPDSYDVALLAAGGGLEAVRRIMSGAVDNAFCAVRPPGHHAERDTALGFCLFNNVALAARFVQREYDMERVMIVDWDVHHGNGTQHTFYEDPTVYYISTHQFPHYPGTGREDERGRGRGQGYTMNFPLPAGTVDETYIRIFEEVVTREAERFDPDFLMISAGFDAHRSDPLAMMALTNDGYAHLTGVVVDIAARHAGGRLLSFLEGGYDLDVLASAVAVHLMGLLGES